MPKIVVYRDSAGVSIFVNDVCFFYINFELANEEFKFKVLSDALDTATTIKTKIAKGL